ncbi:MAG: SdpI family protein [Longimicrobiaceae bacterium]
MRNRWTAPLLIAAMWAFALAVYPRLPDRIPTHWNLRGEADGWGGPGAAFLFPAIATGTWLLMLVLPRIDPRRANWEKFRGEVRLIVSVMVLVFAWIEAVALGAALGWNVDTGRAVMGGVGVLLAVIGNYLPRIRSNWFMGIRTPWTLSSESVWRDTHRIGGRAFVAGGVAMVLAGFIPGILAQLLAIAAVMVSTLIPVVYSYLAWRREAAGRAG